MSEKKTVPKENLTWKINYLAAQVGEKTHVKAAIAAASRTKYLSHHHPEKHNLDPEALKQELYTARKLKLESKMHQARKELKTVLKKAKTAETQKQIKKIKSTRKSLEAPEDKPKKTTQDLEQFEKELEILKALELDPLVEKTLKNKLSKNATLKTQDAIKELIEQIPKSTPVDQTTQNIESRLISNSAVNAEIASIIHAFETIMFGDQEKIEKQKADELKKKKAEEEKKRKAEEEHKRPQKKSKGDTSEFMETLGGRGGGGDDDDESEDEEFKKIYEGDKKPNRAGQRQRRKKWEEMYGRKANHIASEYKKREEKRMANPDYRPKKKPAPKKPAEKQVAEPVHPSWEAKRMQEEMMSKALSGKAPSNNKIVFDDSD